MSYYDDEPTTAYYIGGQPVSREEYYLRVYGYSPTHGIYDPSTFDVNNANSSPFNTSDLSRIDPTIVQPAPTAEQIIANVLASNDPNSIFSNVTLSGDTVILTNNQGNAVIPLSTLQANTISQIPLSENIDISVGKNQIGETSKNEKKYSIFGVLLIPIIIIIIIITSLVKK